MTDNASIIGNSGRYGLYVKDHAIIDGGVIKDNDYSRYGVNVTPEHQYVVGLEIKHGLIEDTVGLDTDPYGGKLAITGGVFVNDVDVKCVNNTATDETGYEAFEVLVNDPSWQEGTHWVVDNKLSLNEHEKTMDENETLTLNATAIDTSPAPDQMDESKTLPIKISTWTSNNEAVATVAAHATDLDKGVVTGVAEGDATIRGTARRHYDECLIHVGGRFFIYHSSDRSVETVPLSRLTEGKYDLTGAVKEGYLYGGYYSDYRFKGSYAGDGVAVTDGRAYNGGEGYFLASQAQSADGTRLEPVSGTTYYLKEVPKAFLRPYTHLLYNRFTGEINKMFLMTNLDDRNYTDFGIAQVYVKSGIAYPLKASFIITEQVNGATALPLCKAF